MNIATSTGRFNFQGMRMAWLLETERVKMARSGKFRMQDGQVGRVQAIINGGSSDGPVSDSSSD